MDKFTEAYIKTALWTNEELDTKEVEDLSEEALNQLCADADLFQSRNVCDIGDREEQAGHDFWLTRNKFGCGFWDGDWPEDAGDRLARSAREFPEVSLYLGDDGKIHLTGDR